MCLYFIPMTEKPDDNNDDDGDFVCPVDAVGLEY